MTWVDEQNLEDIVDMEGSLDLTIKEKCEHLGISRTKFNTLQREIKKRKNEVKNNDLHISRADPRYIRIENYKEHELYRGIVVEAITRIEDIDEIFEVKELSNIKLIQRNSNSMIRIEDVKEAIKYDLSKIDSKIKEVPHDTRDDIANDKYVKKLKNSMYAIRYIQHFIEKNPSLIINILEDNHTTYKDFGIMAPYYEYKKDFIDILIEDIDLSFQAKEGRQGKKIRKLVKYYLLKYMQIPLPYYSIDYSNTLLHEYGFQKVLLEIDTSIPKEDQMDFIQELIEDLYAAEQLSSYSAFIRQNLIEKLKKSDFKKVLGGQLNNNKYEGIPSRKVADMFFIYDVLKNNTYGQCISLLEEYYLDKGLTEPGLSKQTLSSFYKIITIFMEGFKKKYRIHPSSISKEKAAYMEERENARPAKKDN